jgi:Notch-like protein
MRRFSALPALSLALLGAMMIPRDAGAIVLQINGTICPQSNAIVSGLNKGENGAPYTNTGTPGNVVGAGPKGPIDPVFEAAETPQVFAVPKTGGKFNKVTFIDLLEGAGFENTFGWYNVGDDLSNLNNLHTVLTCTPINYEPTPAGNSQLTVDFEAEFVAGRYKGGAVGFFLVTPEGQSGSCSTGNCGNPKEEACVGRIYYTEKPINGDGNYVHYLVYQTKRTDASGKRLDDFYFGFEDLYRGGDNDFEDMLILVQGLVVPCTPSAEVCDGLDNNCDGIVDNNTTDTGLDCYSGPANTVGKGECKAGKTVCASTGPGDKTTVCQGAVLPSAEVCDGKDNNCNSQTDENINNLPNACPPQQGACSAATQCVAGAPTCVPQQGPKPEVCNGLDDDCNGLVDDNLTDSGLPCTPSGNDPTQGECKAGTFACNQGVLACVGYKGPAPELCDGKDNDCDGQTDENPVDLLAKCAPSGVNVCTSGAELCLNGAKVCAGFTLPAPEVCNGVDDDCNGLTDDAPVDTGAPCGNNVGACKAGVVACQNGALTCSGGVSPGNEVCDGLDNDCDGQIDENPANDKLPEVGDACNALGCDGVKVCKDGSLLCVGTGGSAEICDGIDNDCNGVIDDNLTDIGALCGNNLGLCQPGVLACKPKVPGDPKTDELVCEGETKPGTEICDGLDNDCDGFVDENPNQLPGVGIDCGGVGCGAGNTACKNGQIVCLTAGGSGKPEVCNGVDDDCNGLIDDNLIDIDAPCGSSLGECKPGVFVCKPKIPGDPTSNEKVCEGGVDPTDELCDGKDNDCDGKTDEDPDDGGPLVLPGVGDICVQPGTCGSGITLCKSGALVCQPTGQTAAEVCNGVDDDCDGVIDDNPTDAGLPCGTNVGECSQGKTLCVDGALVCDGEVKPSAEACDGLDNNCNGVADEDPDGAGPEVLPGAGEPCPPEGLTLPLQGTCLPGKTVCLGGQFQCLGAVGPADEICDGKDNDCDGTVDSPDPCPGESKCIAGQCAQKCVKQGEFSDCPGGLDCVSGFCVKPGGAGGAGGAGAGGAGGQGAGGDAGQSAGGTSTSAGGASAGGNGQSAGGAAGASGAAGGGGSAAGGSSAGGSSPGAGGGAASGGEGNPADSDGDGKADAWGLATGGGGCSAAPGRTPGGLGAVLLGLLGGVLRRRNGRAGKKEVA